MAAIFASSLDLPRLFQHRIRLIFVELVRESFLIRDIITGVLKSFIFGFLIAAIACYRGLTVKGGRERGRRINNFERGHGDHDRDRFRYALQHHLHHFLSNCERNILVRGRIARRPQTVRGKNRCWMGYRSEVERCERLVIMGQSGSGKSTILRLILGICGRRRVRIFFKQFEITRLSRRKLQQVRRRHRNGLSIFCLAQLDSWSGTTSPFRWRS